MMMNRKILLTIALGLIVNVLVFAQSALPENWHLLDMTTDSFPGISAERTYEQLLKETPGRTVIVAVIDSGVDFEHEDLKDVMWVNADEIPGNGIDDDQNGYVDDIHGWNFIGGADGENVNFDTYEVTRLYVKLKAKYEGVDPATLSKKEKAEYEQYQEYKKEIEQKQEELGPNVKLYSAQIEAMNRLEEAIGKDAAEIALEDLKKFRSSNDMLNSVNEWAKQTTENNDISYKELKDGLQDYFDYLDRQYSYNYNPDFDSRDIVGDNYADPNERYYGNNDVRGPDSNHGTHVAGIIGAIRDNDMGMDGVATNVRIMSVRTVPNGDERDKDVANAIRYAVDNGAAVINMSFGKGASPRKAVVDEAVRYAMKNDVLLVHAAGNDGKENTIGNNFPHDRFEKGGLFKPRYAENWLEVGALSWQNGENLAATFSNYSPEHVDVFAPGVDIYSTTPGSEYQKNSGTSMAAPVVAGIAAVLRSHFPKLTAEQVKEIIMKSATPVKQRVLKPGTDKLVSFNQLSLTGGAVNLYEAIQMASRTKGKRKFDWGRSKKDKGVAIP
jgi:subtilisin family serine protease